MIDVPRGRLSAMLAYLGSKDRFDQSIVDFSHRYADQNEKDFHAFCNAVRSGRLEALQGIWFTREPRRRRKAGRNF